MVPIMCNNVNLVLKLKLSKSNASRIHEKYKALANLGTSDSEYDAYRSTAASKEITGIGGGSGYALSSRVPKKDLQSSIQSHKVVERERIIDNEKQEYDDLNNMSVYDKNAWPKQTNMRCWHCTLYFDTPPCAMPLKFEDGKFHVYGCFCSFNCMVSYNLQSRNSHKWETSGLINLMYDKIYGTIADIKPAPHKEVLREYGGSLTRAEYKKCLEDNITTYELLLPPIVNIGYTIQKIDRKIDEADKKFEYMPLNFKKIDNAALSVERRMFINNKKNTPIDNFIRIKRK